MFFHRSLAQPPARSTRWLWIYVLAAMVMPAQAQNLTSGGAPVVTNRYDNRRSGATLEETVLRPDRLMPDAQGKVGFGKLFVRAVDGPIYAQPLYLPDVAVPGKGRRSLVFVATANNTIYAFDADSCTGKNALPLWARNLGKPLSSSLYDVTVSVPYSYILKAALRLPLTPEMTAMFDRALVPIFAEYRDVYPKIGITGTPVIDPKTGILYVVAATTQEERGRTVYRQRLFALNVATGTIVKGPVTINGSVPGIGDGTNGQKINFDPYFHLQQAGLLLNRGVLYIAFGSHGDLPCAGQYYSNVFQANTYGVVKTLKDYENTHGWLFAYDARTLIRLGACSTSPDAATISPRVQDFTRLRLANPVGAGINMGGVGPAADEKGNVYAVTGRGTFFSPEIKAVANVGGDFGNSLLRFAGKRPGRITVADYFTPADQKKLSASNNTSGMAGVALLPTASDGRAMALTTGLGKPAYLLNRDGLGGNAADRERAAESASPTSPILSGPVNDGSTFPTMPVYWNRGNDAPYLYFWAAGGGPEVWAAQGDRMSLVATTPAVEGQPAVIGPANLALSASGTDVNTGVLWAALPAAIASDAIVGGVLRAYDAGKFDTQNGQTTVHSLWTSEEDATGTDAPGDLPTVATPTIAGGKVYLGTLSGSLIVYGPIQERRGIPATAAVMIDSDRPQINFSREPYLRTQTDARGGIRRAALLRFIVPDFAPGKAPNSAILTLHATNRSLNGIRPEPRRQVNVVIAGVEDAGIWQPGQVNWDNAPGNRAGTRIVSLPGGSHPVVGSGEKRGVPPALSFDVTEWVRAHPGQAMTLFVVSAGPEPLEFHARGAVTPFLTLNWQ